jgi:NAD(P)-dependent dehydrogenase (short-subunit alcohol dehydrogenase family)
MPANPNYPELSEAQQSWRYQPAADCLRGRNILVTGAGSGIGAAAAKTFACYGANVVLLGRTRGTLDIVFDWIEANTNTRPVIVPCDLRSLNDDSAQALHDAIGDGYGQLHGLLHCASVLGPKVPVAHYPSTQWAEVMQVNAFAPFLLTKALLPLMIDHPRRASVVLVSSTVGRQGRAYWGAYAVSKHALEGFMQVLADEHETAGKLKVNTVNPGATRTAMRATAYPGENPAEVPIPEAKLDLFIYLMEEASEAVTGQALDARHWSGPGS